MLLPTNTPELEFRELIALRKLEIKCDGENIMQMQEIEMEKAKERVALREERLKETLHDQEVREKFEKFKERTMNVVYNKYRKLFNSYRRVTRW